MHSLSLMNGIHCGRRGLADTDSCLSNGADVLDRASVFVGHTQSSCVQKENWAATWRKQPSGQRAVKTLQLPQLTAVELQFARGLKL